MEWIQAAPRPCHHHRFPIRFIRRPPPSSTPTSLEQISQPQTTLMNWRCNRQLTLATDLRPCASAWYDGVYAGDPGDLGSIFPLDSFMWSSFRTARTNSLRHGPRRRSRTSEPRLTITSARRTREDFGGICASTAAQLEPRSLRSWRLSP